ncbi:MAG: DNA recombination protein RmuC [Candidatus Paceibacterota bacterium]
MVIEIIIILVVSLVAFAIVSFIIVRLFKEERQRMLEQMDSKKEVINESIKFNKDSIKELVEKIGSELEKTKNQFNASEKERVGEFSALKTILEEHKLATGELKQSTENLKNILSNNQMRGAFGEEIADNLLKSIGFVEGENYISNTAQENSASRPDFTVFLPDKTKVNIDVKFPYQSLIKYIEAADKVDKDKHLKEFAQDVKQKIKEVSTRDYINLEEKTVDFVILFVPNEMIFSFIYEHLPEVWNEAMGKKVILAGPFSFTAILRMIYQSYKSFKYQENLYEIIKLIKMFEMEFGKYNDEVDTLGTRLKSASDQFDKVSVTRTKKLSGIVEKIKGEAEENKMIENQPDIIEE